MKDVPKYEAKLKHSQRKQKEREMSHRTTVDEELHVFTDGVDKP